MTASTTSTPKRRTITLTDHAPISITEDDWPVIAVARWHDGGQFESQANRTASIRVRQHADGRTIVYGGSESAWQDERNLRAGRLLCAGVDPVATIHEIAEAIGRADLADTVIADLPVVKLE